MTTIQIEANVSMEQLLRAVDQLPPQEFAAFLVHLLTRLRGVAEPAPSAVVDDDVRRSSERLMPKDDNPYLAAAGIFAAEVNAYFESQRRRERDAAAREADA
jgi:hypothetical protein